MKLAFFFVLSAALHALAFLYPISFPGAGSEHLTPVAIVSLEHESGAPGNHTTASKEVRVAAPKTTGKRSPAPLITQPLSIAPGGQPAPSSEDSKKISTGVTVVLSADFLSHESAASASTGVTSIGNGTVGTGQSETGSDLPIGRVTGKSASQYTQVRYGDTPRPRYPEVARRDGKEGLVLLRVLVNQEGRSASVEVNRSSGVEALDQAAVEAIKRWRFSPARYGDRPVESWVRIPIEFRLSDARD